jgi:hypothetical protein
VSQPIGQGLHQIVSAGGCQGVIVGHTRSLASEREHIKNAGSPLCRSILP